MIIKTLEKIKESLKVGHEFLRGPRVLKQWIEANDHLAIENITPHNSFWYEYLITNSNIQSSYIYVSVSKSKRLCAVYVYIEVYHK